jgi:competence ComEA-like helix-hairpin-helix protein
MAILGLPERIKRHVIRISIGLCFIGLLSQVLTAPKPEEDNIIPASSELNISPAALLKVEMENKSAGEENRVYVDINSCAEEELRSLPGIGKTLARRIIEFRSEYGFKRKEDLMFVKGIGLGKYNNLKMLIVVK